MSQRIIQKLALGALLVVLIAAAYASVSIYNNTRAALPLYLGVAAVGALFMRVVMAPDSSKRTPK